jgi:putative transcriptional regulator
LTPKELQELLISKRDSLGLTQQDVVNQSNAGITRQYYGMIENGERRPSVDVAKKISNVLNLEWTIFFEVKCNHKSQNIIKSKVV